MPDTGFVLAGTGASEAYTGSDAAWSNPTRVTASDDSRTTANTGSAGAESEYLKASGFALSSVPGGATIDGVEVRVERSVGTGSGNINDQHIYIRKGDGGSLSNDKKQTGVNWAGTDEQVVYGGASDLWGLGIAQSDLADLQVLVSAVAVGGGKQPASTPSKSKSTTRRALPASPAPSPWWRDRKTKLSSRPSAAEQRASRDPPGRCTVGPG